MRRLNPLPRRTWGYTQSVAMISEIFEERMYPLTLEGLNEGIAALAR